MTLLNKATQKKKIGWWGSLKAVWRRATPAQRMGVFVIVGVLIFLLSLITSYLSPDSRPETEPAGETQIEGITGPKTGDKSKAVIEDTTSELGIQNLQAENARVNFEASQGRSAIQSLVVSGEETPFDDVQRRSAPTAEVEPASEIQEVTAKPPAKPKRKDVFAVQTKTPANTGSSTSAYGLSADTIQQLQGAEQNPNNDPYIGFGSKEEYLKALNPRVKEVGNNIGKATELYISNRTEMSSGITMVAMQPTSTTGANWDEQRPSAQTGSNALNQANQKQGQIEPPPMLLDIGDSIPVYVPYEVDSRVSGAFVAIVLTGKLKDARLRCAFQNVEDFLVPNCTEISFAGKKHPIEAMVINPSTFGNIVDQDIDDDTFLKSIAKFGSNALQTFGVAKLAQGVTRVEDSDSNTTTTTNSQSDRQIVLGSLAVGLGELAGAAEEYYQQPSVKTIPKNTQMLLVMTNPIPDVFGVSEQQTMGYTR